MKTEMLSEWAVSEKPSVDRETSVIRGVRILGLSSKNNREYAEEAVKKAVPLYEGRHVNVDHGDIAARSYRDRIGALENVRFADAGLRGDLKVNPKHPLAEQLFWDAENLPNAVGMSHVVEGVTARKEGGGVHVEEIVAVASVDLVANPATTQSLFESEERMKTKLKEEGTEVAALAPYAPVPTATGDPKSSLASGFEAAILDIVRGEGDGKTKLGKIKALFDAQDKANAAMEKATDSHTSTPEAQEEKTEATESVDADALKSQIAAMWLLEEAGIPKTPDLVNAIAAIPNEDGRKEVIKAMGSKVAAPRFGTSPVKRLSEEVEAPKNAQEYVKAITL